MHYVTVTVQDILRGDGIAVHPGTASNDDDHLGTLTGVAVALPAKLLGEQLEHPAPLIFFVTYS